MAKIYFFFRVKRFFKSFFLMLKRNFFNNLKDLNKIAIIQYICQIFNK